jgi:hypothetical protein
MEFPDSPARRFAHAYGGEADARVLTLEAHLCNALAYIHLAAAALDAVPAWTLALSIPILVPRWMIAVHELFHLRSEREVDPVMRLLPFLFTPLSLGYRELLTDHRGHHLHMARSADPELYQLRGSPLQGLVNAFTAPEQMWFRWRSRHGIDNRLMAETGLRLVLFMGLAAGGGIAFVWYLASARMAFGLSYFIFFYALHRRGEEYGVYPLALPAWVVKVVTLLLGPVVVQATLHHDVHHAQPRIAARHLAGMRAAVSANGD